MTPQQLLKEVQGRFVVLYHKDELTLNRLLTQALTKFQDKAGVLFTLCTEESQVAIPDGFWRVASCHDSASRFVPTQPDRESGVLYLGVEPRNRPPYTVHYLIKLTAWPLDRDLPTSCLSLVSDYLEALLAIPNAERARGILNATGQSSDHLPSVQELRSRITELEQEMEEAKAILPPIAVY